MNGWWWLQRLLEDITTGRQLQYAPICRYHALSSPINEDQWIYYKANINTNISRNTTGATFMIRFYETHSVFIFTLLYANFLYCFLMMCFYIDVKVDVWLWLESLLRKDELTFIHRQCCPNGWIDRRRLFTKKRPRHYQRLHLYSDILQAHFLFRIKNHQQIEASPQTFYWLKPL